MHTSKENHNTQEILYLLWSSKYLYGVKEQVNIPCLCFKGYLYFCKRDFFPFYKQHIPDWQRRYDCHLLNTPYFFKKKYSPIQRKFSTEHTANAERNSHTYELSGRAWVWFACSCLWTSAESHRFLKTCHQNVSTKRNENTDRFNVSGV